MYSASSVNISAHCVQLPLLADSLAATMNRSCAACNSLRSHLPISTSPTFLAAPTLPRPCRGRSAVRLRGDIHLAGPRGVHLGIPAARGHQLVVASPLDDPALVDDHDPV